MNGVGKSNFGRSLASKLQMKRIDTDVEFRKRHGKEEGYIRLHGWAAFRKMEEEIVFRSLLPGHVVILGGGSVESPDVRKALREKATVLWLQAGRKRVQKHLKAAKVQRPEFAKGLMSATVKVLLQERTPLYGEVAHFAIQPRVRFSEQIPVALGFLRTKQFPGAARRARNDVR
ncbi:MAG: shikimate kinase [Candidatus Peribacteraceae bacterium]|nr:shikimate kinase [Candidatus Peribacteraceae bacterium]